MTSDIVLASSTVHERFSHPQPLGGPWGRGPQEPPRTGPAADQQFWTGQTLRATVSSLQEHPGSVPKPIECPKADSQEHELCVGRPWELHSERDIWSVLQGQVLP